MFVGVGQRERQEPLANPGAKFFLHSRQASADFTQRLGVPQLTKKHGNELTPATETAGMTFRFALGVPQIQIPGEDQLQNL